MSRTFAETITDVGIFTRSRLDGDTGAMHPEPPELVMRVDHYGFPARHDHVTARSGGTDWTIREYNDVLIDFVRLGDMQETFEIDDPDIAVKRLAEFNVSGASEFAYFPVRIVNTKGDRSRVLYAPVPWVRNIISEADLGNWSLTPDIGSAERGMLVWILLDVDWPEMVTVDGDDLDNHADTEPQVALQAPDQPEPE